MYETKFNLLIVQWLPCPFYCSS